MASVLVTIAGRSYRMACDDGEEKRLEELAASVDAKIAGMKSGFGDIGDQRIVVMAAVAIADEAYDAKAKIAALEAEKAALKAENEAEVAALRAELDKAGREAEAGKEALARDFEAAAQRVERILADLRSGGGEI